MAHELEGDGFEALRAETPGPGLGWRHESKPSVLYRCAWSDYQTLHKTMTRVGVGISMPNGCNFEKFPRPRADRVPSLF